MASHFNSTRQTSLLGVIGSASSLDLASPQHLDTSSSSSSCSSSSSQAQIETPVETPITPATTTTNPTSNTPAKKRIRRRPLSRTTPPRPANCFILYRREKHAELLKKNPTIKNEVVSRIVSESWKNEPEHIRQRYIKLALEAKEEHERLYPGYRYQPKPSKKEKTPAILVSSDRKRKRRDSNDEKRSMNYMKSTSSLARTSTNNAARDDSTTSRHGKKTLSPRAKSHKSNMSDSGSRYSRSETSSCCSDYSSDEGSDSETEYEDRSNKRRRHSNRQPSKLAKLISKRHVNNISSNNMMTTMKSNNYGGPQQTMTPATELSRTINLLNFNTGTVEKYALVPLKESAPNDLSYVYAPWSSGFNSMYDVHGNSEHLAEHYHQEVQHALGGLSHEPDHQQQFAKPLMRHRSKSIVRIDTTNIPPNMPQQQSSANVSNGVNGNGSGSTNLSSQQSPSTWLNLADSPTKQPSADEIFPTVEQTVQTRTDSGFSDDRGYGKLSKLDEQLSQQKAQPNQQQLQTPQTASLQSLQSQRGMPPPIDTATGARKSITFSPRHAIRKGFGFPDHPIFQRGWSPISRQSMGNTLITPTTLSTPMSRVASDKSTGSVSSPSNSAILSPSSWLDRELSNAQLFATLNSPTAVANYPQLGQPNHQQRNGPLSRQHSEEEMTKKEMDKLFETLL